jgi:hypothetical protein
MGRVVSGSPGRDDRRVLGGHQNLEERRVALRLDDFAAEAIDEEADRLGISVEDLVSFSVLYYLADVDSGRIARQIPTSHYPEDGR